MQIRVKEKVKQGRSENIWEKTVARHLRRNKLVEHQPKDRKSWDLATSTPNSIKSGKKLRDDDADKKFIDKEAHVVYDNKCY